MTSLGCDDRGVSTTVSYAITLVITTLLVTGLLVAGGDFVGSQREQATLSELRVLGQQLAGDISAADRLARTSGPDGDVTLRRGLPERIAGSNYRINVSRMAGSNTTVLHFASDNPEEQSEVRVHTTTPVFTTGNLTGGEVEVSHNSVREELVLRRPGPFVFQEENDRVVIKAESFPEDQPGDGEWSTHYWKAYNLGSGEKALTTYPNVSTSGGAGDTTEGPRLDYEVNLESTGPYYVWVLLRAPSDGDGGGNSNSVHAGIEGTIASTGGNGMGVSTDQNWDWVNTVENNGTRVTVSPTSPGQTTFSIWMREDGTQIDKIILTTDSSYTPTGDGPSESEWA